VYSDISIPASQRRSNGYLRGNNNNLLVFLQIIWLLNSEIKQHSSNNNGPKKLDGGVGGQKHPVEKEIMDIHC
jgi:hypothetical protein